MNRKSNRGRRLTLLASPLLALAVGGIGWASVANPGPTNFVEIDSPANVGFDGLPNALFDWANAGANATPRACTETPLSGGSCTCNSSGVCSGTECLKSCSGSGGLFDAGVYHSATSNPTPPAPTAAATANNTIAALTFGVDELGISTNVAKVCTVGFNSCITDADCTQGTGDTCKTCGGGDPTVYTGQGSETNNSDLNSDTFSTATVPNKDDINNVYAIAHQSPVPLTGAATDTNEIFAGFERVINNGDSHVDLEFLQLPVQLVPAASCVGGTTPGAPCVTDADCAGAGATCKGNGSAFPCQGKFKGGRTPNDLLIAVDFTKGGALGSVQLYQWVCGNVAPGPDGSCDPNGNKNGPHYALSTNPNVSAAVKARVNNATCSGSGADCLTNKDCPANQTCVQHDEGCGGWACRNASGVETSTIPTNELFEVGVDLAAIGFNGCISSFLPHTRSSQSFTAVLKDFKLLQFNTCRPSTVLTKQVCDANGMNCAASRTISAGESVVYKYAEQNDSSNVVLENPHVTDASCSPITLDSPSGDANSDGKLDPGETWHFKCTKTNVQADVVNTAFGHGDFKTPAGTIKDVTACQGSCSTTTTQSCYVDVDPNPTFGTIGCPEGEFCVLPDPTTTTFCDQDEVAQANVTVLTPSTCLKKSATVTSVSATVLYKYDEKNDGQVALDSPSVEDAECTSNGGTITLDNPSGDTNTNSKLDPGETWHFKCTATFSNITADTNFIDIAKSHGCFTSGGVTKDVTVSGATAACGATAIFADADETDTKTVSVTFPTVSGGKASCQ